MSWMYDQMARNMCKTPCQQCGVDVCTTPGMHFGILCDKCLEQSGKGFISTSNTTTPKETR